MEADEVRSIGTIFCSNKGTNPMAYSTSRFQLGNDKLWRDIFLCLLLFPYLK